LPDRRRGDGKGEKGNDDSQGVSLATGWGVIVPPTISSQVSGPP
jgi:hypothetical protein